MPQVRLDALRIAWRVRSGTIDPARVLLGGLASESVASSDAPPDVTIAIEARRAPTSDAGFRQTFHHFALRGLECEGEHLLLSPWADVRVSRDGREIFLAVDPAADARSVANIDLFIALTIALRVHGLFHAHAGAVVRADGTRVLVAGDSGAGKSTVTLSLLEPGAHYLGDDALFLTREGGRPVVLAFPRPFHLGPATLSAFPGLREHASHEASEGKHDLELSAVDRTGARATAQMASPQVLLFPRITAEDHTRATPLDAMDAFGSLLRATAFAVVDGMPRARDQLDLLREMTVGAQAYDVALGRDWLARGPRAAELLPFLQKGPARNVD